MLSFARVSVVFTTPNLIKKLGCALGNHSSPVSRIVIFGSDNFSLENELNTSEFISSNENNKKNKQHSKNDTELKNILTIENENETSENEDDEDDIPDVFIDEFDQEQHQQKLIQKELESMEPEKVKLGLPKNCSLIKSSTLFKIFHLNSSTSNIDEEGDNDIEIQKKKMNEIAFIFFSGGRFIGLTHKNMISSVIQTKYQKLNDYEPDKTLISSFFVDFYTVLAFRLYFIETLLEFGTVVCFECIEVIKTKRIGSMNDNGDDGETTTKLEAAAGVLNNNSNQIGDRYEEISVVEKKLDLTAIFRKLAYWEVNTLYVIPSLINDIIEDREIWTGKLGLALETIVSSSGF